MLTLNLKNLVQILINEKKNIEFQISNWGFVQL